MATNVQEYMNYEISSNSNNRKPTCKYQIKTHLYSKTIIFSFAAHWMRVYWRCWNGFLLCLCHICCPLSISSRLSHLHLEACLCSRLGMSCDFMRYLFCGLVLGDKRWQDFICILVCVSSSCVAARYTLNVELKNVTRRRCEASNEKKKLLTISWATPCNVHINVLRLRWGLWLRRPNLLCHPFRWDNQQSKINFDHTHMHTPVRCVSVCEYKYV